MEIHKKTWPDCFKKLLEGTKNADVRLADFELHQGDIIVFEEYLPETKEYTGRKVVKQVKALTKIYPAKYNSLEDIKEYGQWLIELK